ncbi:MAG: hypothetical protein ACFFG0_01995 [Candidatus Thorarchaeota archaeon]
MRIPFRERAPEMGLESFPEKGLFRYSDRFGEVVYRQLSTMFVPLPSNESPHETDNQITPLIAIFTKPADSIGYTYCGYVSDIYQFIGNEVLNQQIVDSILEVGIPILNQNTILSNNLTMMRNEIIIQNGEHVPEVGDVLPVMVVNNNYNGNRAASVSFGISTYVNRDRVVFSFNLGEMRQVHIANSDTQMSSVVSSYMEMFSGSIFDLIEQNFRSILTEEQMLGTLDLIEKVGMRRREEITKILQELNPPSEGEDPPLPSAWQMFLAIVRYSSFEQNLNAKRLLENAAESVLVIPPRMYEVLERLQSS